MIVPILTARSASDADDPTPSCSRVVFRISVAVVVVVSTCSGMTAMTKKKTNPARIFISSPYWSEHERLRYTDRD